MKNFLPKVFLLSLKILLIFLTIAYSEQDKIFQGKYIYLLTDLKRLNPDDRFTESISVYNFLKAYRTNLISPADNLELLACQTLACFNEVIPDTKNTVVIIIHKRQLGFVHQYITHIDIFNAEFNKLIVRRYIKIKHKTSEFSDDELIWILAMLDINDFVEERGSSIVSILKKKRASQSKLESKMEVIIEEDNTHSIALNHIEKDSDTEYFKLVPLPEKTKGFYEDHKHKMAISGLVVFQYFAYREYQRYQDSKSEMEKYESQRNSATTKSEYDKKSDQYDEAYEENRNSYNMYWVYQAIVFGFCYWEYTNIEKDYLENYSNVIFKPNYLPLTNTFDVSFSYLF